MTLKHKHSKMSVMKGYTRHTLSEQLPSWQDRIQRLYIQSDRGMRLNEVQGNQS